MKMNASQNYPKTNPKLIVPCYFCIACYLMSKFDFQSHFLVFVAGALSCLAYIKLVLPKHPTFKSDSSPPQPIHLPNKAEQPVKPPAKKRYMWENIVHKGTNSSSNSLTSLDSSSGNESRSARVDSDSDHRVTKLVDIGDIFGMDVGGTLSKLIYFERMDNPREKVAFVDAAAVKHEASEEGEEAVTSRSRSNSESGNNHKKNNYLASETKPPSLDDNSTSQVTSATKNALSKFYSFVNAKNAFGETGKKDEKLTFYSRKLGGEFGFIRFETRFMQGAVDVIKNEGLHQDIAR